MSNLVLKQLAPKGYLRAAINLSNFLLVTGQDGDGNPQGVSPDMAKALANKLGVELKLISFKRPGELADAVSEDVWDIGNIANETERAKSISFSLPYTLIESTYLVRESLNIKNIKNIDQEGIRIAVAERSAYDLWLTENFKNVELIRVNTIEESHQLFREDKVNVLAGLKPKLIEEIKPHQIYAAGDLSDPHGTHRVCLEAIFQALRELKDQEWMKDCYVWLYRGAWQEWDIEDIEMAVPLSPEETDKKRRAIFKHQSQKDRPLFPGTDKREFWQRADDRTRSTAETYDQLGLAEYEAMEAFVRWKELDT